MIRILGRIEEGPEPEATLSDSSPTATLAPIPAPEAIFEEITNPQSSAVQSVTPNDGIGTGDAAVVEVL